MWVDGVFMGGMFLLAHARYVGERARCLQEAVRQLDCIYRCCHKERGLLYHAWSEEKSTVWADPQTGCSPEVWSKGLGWYALILTETVRALPEGDPDRARLSARLEELLCTLCALQNEEDGLWFQVVDRPEGVDNWTDTSGSAMFIYALSQAPAAPDRRSLFQEAARRGMEGVHRRAKPGADGGIDVECACDGLCVQKSYADYVYYPRSLNAKEAVGAALWAAESMERGSLSLLG
jgi:unsaturated rhamnogalacturonyl hydrolase